jgi:four helix bundle protein
VRTLDTEGFSEGQIGNKMREPAKKFEDLVVWQKLHQFVLSIYRITEKFPVEDRYVLTDQLKRAANSAPANISEGFKKNSKAEKKRFFSIAQGSLEEARYYLILADDLGYCDSDKLWEQAEEVSKLLVSYSRAIKKSNF